MTYTLAPRTIQVQVLSETARKILPNAAACVKNTKTEEPDLRSLGGSEIVRRALFTHRYLIFQPRAMPCPLFFFRGSSSRGNFVMGGRLLRIGAHFCSTGFFRGSSTVTMFKKTKEWNDGGAGRN